MGDVYRARDTRLRREVALKMLHDVDANDEDSLVRFQRETHAVASLNHPNILAIHDTGMHRGAPFAVTELLQGETLAERLESGPIAPARAADVACQIADGLSAAHARGVDPSGHQAGEHLPDQRRPGQDPRLRHRPNREPRFAHGRVANLRASGSTSSQMLVGTAGYVSPEQVRGGKRRRRSDSSRSAPCSSRCWPGERPSSAARPSTPWAPSSGTTPGSYPESEKIPAELRPVRLPLPREGSRRPLPVRARPALRPAGAPGGGRSAKPPQRIKFRSVPPWKHRRRHADSGGRSATCALHPRPRGRVLLQKAAARRRRRFRAPPPPRRSEPSAASPGSGSPQDGLCGRDGGVESAAADRQSRHRALSAPGSGACSRSPCTRRRASGAGRARSRRPR